MSAGRPGRFPCFDGLRAFAALSVVGVHTAFSSGFTFRSGWGIYTSRLEIGVSVFFLISGFLLYRPMAVAHLGGPATLRPGQFLVRRALRIVPAYWVALTVLGYGLHAVNMGGVRGALLHYGFLQIYSREHVLGGITQAWSLCTEVTFYLFLPLYALAIAGRRRTGRAQVRAELVGVAVLLAVSVGFRAWLFLAHPPMTDQMAIWLPSYLDLFAAGMALAVLSAWHHTGGTEPAVLGHPAVPWVSWAAAGMVYWGVSHAHLPVTPLYRATYAQSLERQELYGLFALLLLIPAVFGPQDRGLVRRALAWRPVALIGVVSYGIYLWHQGVVTELFSWTGRKMFHIPAPTLLWATVGLSTAVAAVSYAGVERWFLRLKPGRRPAAAPPPASLPAEDESDGAGVLVVEPLAAPALAVAAGDAP
ncbi:MAG TPA: acyltransferase [Acidimicrobiales bacterium]|nr:acyltransferase [Acidimicrobiales bacterium]